MEGKMARNSWLQIVSGVVLSSVLLLGLAPLARAFSANQVFFEKRADGRVRVIVNYTVPGLREYREAFVDFTKESDAAAAYWNLVRGADFYIKDAKTIAFAKPQLQPIPW